jgi:AraC-like DNA-binding protein
MPQNGQRPGAPVPDGTIAVRSLGLRLPPHHRIERHAHDWHQLVYATEGVMTVDTPAGSWVVPPHRAVWMPAGVEHSIRMTGVVRMRTLYFRPGLAHRGPPACCVIHVSPLLRELILETLRLGMLADDVPEHVRLAGVLADQIAHTREAPLRITRPTDARARVVAELAQADLSATASIAQLARGSGASVRTVERLFVLETGMTFGRWLQHVKALHALERLAAGESVTAAGLAVGYDSTSAFIAMFKRVLGTTPGSYFKQEPAGPPQTRAMTPR